MSQTQIEDERLLSAIREKYSAYIDSACRGSGFPASLLAALTANESGIDPTKSRFESNVFVDLADVLCGASFNFGAIKGQDVSRFLGAGVLGGRFLSRRVVQAIGELKDLATSWGPTQIMGYQVLGFRGSVVPEELRNTIATLRNLDTHYVVAVALLGQFRTEFRLPDPAVDASGYFHCWNSGSPAGRTFDPNYAANGIRRMKIYEGLQ